MFNYETLTVECDILYHFTIVLSKENKETLIQQLTQQIEKDLGKRYDIDLTFKGFEPAEEDDIICANFSIRMEYEDECEVEFSDYRDGYDGCDCDTYVHVSDVFYPDIEYKTSQALVQIFKTFPLVDYEITETENNSRTEDDIYDEANDLCTERYFHF